MDNAYLCHHGVKGMKWGVRRAVDKARKRLNLRFAEGAARDAYVNDSYAKARGNYSKTLRNIHLKTRDNNLKQFYKYKQRAGEEFTKKYGSSKISDTEVLEIGREAQEWMLRYYVLKASNRR